MEKDFITKLDEYLESREWTDEERLGLYAVMGKNAVRSAETVLDVLKYQQETDEYNTNADLCDNWTGVHDYQQSLWD